MKKGLLYVNLGTPEALTLPAVKKFLRSFLMDPLVIDIPFPLRFILINAIILPIRTKKSKEAYSQIWTSEGSPLMTNSCKFIKKLQARMGSDFPVELAMRYGEPSIETAIAKLQSQGAQQIQVLTAYPQYALSSTETALKEVRRIMNARFNIQTQFIESYELDAGFIEAYAQNIKAEAASFKPDYYLFSYHGLPVRHVQKTGVGCVGSGSCSLTDSPGNSRCYRRQCYRTTTALVARLDLSQNQFSVGFQSRLTSGWIKPFTDDFFLNLPKRGVRRLLVVCPSFTTDCLETLEEIAIRGREEFIREGGQDLRLVPCLNDSDLWVKSVHNMVNNSKLWRAL